MQQRRYTVSVEERGKYWRARVYLEGEGGKDRRFSTGVLVGADRKVSKPSMVVLVPQVPLGSRGSKAQARDTRPRRPRHDEAVSAH
jgi:hypothetical protein